MKEEEEGEKQIYCLYLSGNPVVLADTHRVLALVRHQSKHVTNT